MINKHPNFNLFTIGLNQRAIDFYFGGELSPHVRTQRLSYTVPISRGAIILSGNLSIMLGTTSTVRAEFNSDLEYTAAGANPIIISKIADFRHLGFEPQRSANITFLHLLAKDTITTFSTDLSTGGSKQIIHSYNIIEFDV